MRSQENSSCQIYTHKLSFSPLEKHIKPNLVYLLDSIASATIYLRNWSAGGIGNCRAITSWQINQFSLFYLTEPLLHCFNWPSHHCFCCWIHLIFSLFYLLSAAFLQGHLPICWHCPEPSASWLINWVFLSLTVGWSLIAAQFPAFHIAILSYSRSLSVGLLSFIQVLLLPSVLLLLDC